MNDCQLNDYVGTYVIGLQVAWQTRVAVQAVRLRTIWGPQEFSVGKPLGNSDLHRPAVLCRSRCWVVGCAPTASSRGRTMPNRVFVIIVVLVCSAAVDGARKGKRHAPQRSVQTSRPRPSISIDARFSHDPTVPRSSSPEVRDAIALLEQARIRLCEAELALYHSERMETVDIKPRYSVITNLVAAGPGHFRIRSLMPIYSDSLKRLTAILDHLTRAALDVDGTVKDHIQRDSYRKRIRDVMLQAYSSSTDLTVFSSSTLYNGFRARDNHFEDLPALQFWNSTSVTPGEIVSAAGRLDEQARRAYELSAATSKRNDLLDQTLSEYTKHCRLVMEGIKQPMVIAVAQYHDGQANATAAYAQLTEGSGKVIKLLKFVDEQRMLLRQSDELLQLVAHFLELISTTLDRIQYTVDIITSPDPAEVSGAPDPAPSKTKAKKKKKKRADKPTRTDETYLPSVPHDDVNDDAEDVQPEYCSPTPVAAHSSTRELPAAYNASVACENVSSVDATLEIPTPPQSSTRTIKKKKKKAKSLKPATAPAAPETPPGGCTAHMSSGDVECPTLTNTTADDLVDDQEGGVDGAPSYFGDAHYDMAVETWTESCHGETHVWSLVNASSDNSNSTRALKSSSPSTLSAASPAFVPTWLLSPGFLHPGPDDRSPIRIVDSLCPSSMQRTSSLDSLYTLPANEMTSLDRAQDFQMTLDLRDVTAAFEENRRRDNGRHHYGFRAVEHAVHRLFPNVSDVIVSGSVVYGLHLPAPISDLDLVVHHSTLDVSDGLLQLFRRIQQDPTFSSVDYIPMASTPIIKATVANSSVNIDVAWNAADVERTRQFIYYTLIKFPLFKPITMYMKYYLHMHGLGNPYYGGIGSFHLYLLVLYHLQVRYIRLTKPLTVRYI